MLGAEPTRLEPGMLALGRGVFIETGNGTSSDLAVFRLVFLQKFLYALSIRQAPKPAKHS